MLNHVRSKDLLSFFSSSLSFLLLFTGLASIFFVIVSVLCKAFPLLCTSDEDVLLVVSHTSGRSAASIWDSPFWKNIVHNKTYQILCFRTFYNRKDGRRSRHFTGFGSEAITRFSSVALISKDRWNSTSSNTDNCVLRFNVGYLSPRHFPLSCSGNKHTNSQAPPVNQKTLGTRLDYHLIKIHIQWMALSYFRTTWPMALPPSSQWNSHSLTRSLLQMYIGSRESGPSPSWVNFGERLYSLYIW